MLNFDDIRTSSTALNENHSLVFGFDHDFVNQGYLKGQRVVKRISPVGAILFSGLPTRGFLFF
jgi:hypothetical protein